jgi:hypothetical protein
MKLPLTGRCLCGTIRYELTEAPQLVYTCHCTDCQRITSSAFSLGIALPETAFHLTAGEPRAPARARQRQVSAHQSKPIARSIATQRCGCAGGCGPNTGSGDAEAGRIHSPTSTGTSGSYV